jgi:hypothetical protein
VGLALIACGRLDFDVEPGVTTDAAAHSIDAPSDPRLAPMFVQYADAEMDPSQQLAVSFMSPVTAGDLLVVTAAWQSSPLGDIAALHDSFDDTFTRLAPIGGEAGITRTYVTYAVAGMSGSNVVMASITNPGDFVVRIHEYANVDPVQPVDSYVTNTGDAIGSDAITAAVTTTVPNELVFAYAVSTAGQATAGTGFTARSTISGDVTEDEIVATPSTIEAVASTNAADWTIQVVTVRGSGT